MAHLKPVTCEKENRSKEELGKERSRSSTYLTIVTKQESPLFTVLGFLRSKTSCLFWLYYKVYEPFVLYPPLVEFYF